MFLVEAAVHSGYSANSSTVCDWLDALEAVDDYRGRRRVARAEAPEVRTPIWAGAHLDAETVCDWLDAWMIAWLEAVDDYRGRRRVARAEAPELRTRGPLILMAKLGWLSGYVPGLGVHDQAPL